MIYSMTAFAQQTTDSPWGMISWELRSLNNRYLDLNFRIPEEVRDLESSLREILKQSIGRGKVDCQLKLEKKFALNSEISLNLPVVRNLIQACHAIAADLPNAESISALDILKWPGVIAENNIDLDVLKNTIKHSFEIAVKNLNAARHNEGAELVTILLAKLDAVSQQLQKLQQEFPAIMQQQRDRLNAKLADLQLAVDQTRLEQEIVYLTHKADIAEEIDRLLIHVAEAKRCCNQQSSIGKKMDFLLQEMNREANTIASKSAANLSSAIAIELKVLIEQMREQVQNLE